MTEEQIEQFGELRKPLNNIGGMAPGAPSRNAPGFANASAPTVSALGTGNIILNGALILVLVAALIFAARFKKNY